MMRVTKVISLTTARAELSRITVSVFFCAAAAAWLLAGCSSNTDAGSTTIAGGTAQPTGGQAIEQTTPVGSALDGDSEQAAAVDQGATGSSAGNGTASNGTANNGTAGNGTANNGTASTDSASGTTGTTSGASGDASAGAASSNTTAEQPSSNDQSSNTTGGPASNCQAGYELMFAATSIDGGTRYNPNGTETPGAGRVQVEMCRASDGSLQFFERNLDRNEDVRLDACQNLEGIWEAQSGDLSYLVVDKVTATGTAGLTVTVSDGTIVAFDMVKDTIYTNQELMAMPNYECPG